jgi:hypothetical protein
MLEAGLTLFEETEVFVSLKSECPDIIADYKYGDIIICWKHDWSF